MSFTLILLLGLIAVISVLTTKNKLINIFGENKVTHKLQNAKWFHNVWLTGLFLFLTNAFLFFLTGLILYVLMYFLIPYVHLLVMCLAVIISILIWMFINQAWQGTKKEQIKIAIIGSAFYLILTLFGIYKYLTIEPLYPGEDTFMRALGLSFLIIVTVVAFITCFIMTGFSKGKRQLN